MTRKNLWGGRFNGSTSDALKRLNDSLSFDIALFDEEIEASTAWAQALVAAGVLSNDEKETIVTALKQIEAKPNADAEDVHSFVEAELTRKIGPLAGKLHTGRSRNDQVATDLRLYLKKAFKEARQLTLDLSSALVTRAEAEADTAMPGYTHLKQAEPIIFGHWCLAYTEMLLRDLSRFDEAYARADECPLGSGALAGTPLPIDREALARALGFARPTANSLDAVSDRDCVADYLFTATMLLGHLSRLAEDLIILSSDEFGFVELPDALATGSSRMPQKKNPDLLELVRGHAARTIGELTGLLSLLKGLPLAYNKDLQLDKEPLFRVRTVLSAVLPALTQLIETLKLNRERMRQMASSEALLATERADALARNGVPFRQAHEMVGLRIAGGGTISEPITVEDALERKSALGGTAPDRVREAARAARKRIGEIK